LTRLLHFRCLLPLLLSYASLPAFPGPLNSAWPKIDIHDLLNAVAPAQPATKLLLLPNFASPATTGDGTSGFLRVMHPATRAAKRISEFHRTFTFLRGRKCSFQIAVSILITLPLAQSPTTPHAGLASVTRGTTGFRTPTGNWT
jgi:hypothetical protein